MKTLLTQLKEFQEDRDLDHGSWKTQINHEIKAPKSVRKTAYQLLVFTATYFKRNTNSDLSIATAANHLEISRTELEPAIELLEKEDLIRLTTAQNNDRDQTAKRFITPDPLRIAEITYEFSNPMYTGLDYLYEWSETRTEGFGRDWWAGM